MIKYYLERNSKNNFNNFEDKNKYELKVEVEKKEFKNILSKFKNEFKLEIEFRNIEDKKYPINIRFDYYEEDKNIANKTIKKLKEIMTKIGIKNYFIGELLKKK